MTLVFDEKEWYSINKMSGYIKRMFIVAMTFVGCGALKCVSMNNQ